MAQFFYPPEKLQNGGCRLVAPRYRDVDYYRCRLLSNYILEVMCYMTKKKKPPRSPTAMISSRFWGGTLFVLPIFSKPVYIN